MGGFGVLDLKRLIIRNTLIQFDMTAMKKRTIGSNSNLHFFVRIPLTCHLPALSIDLCIQIQILEGCNEKQSFRDGGFSGAGRGVFRLWPIAHDV
jgi:hypothetical protein